MLNNGASVNVAADGVEGNARTLPRLWQATMPARPEGA